jgi:hypothetical protein
MVELDPFKREDEEKTYDNSRAGLVTVTLMIFGNIIFWSLVIYLIRSCVR